MGKKIMDDEHRYSSVVTSFFYVLGTNINKSFTSTPGLNILVGTLVRCAAHKIYVPYRQPRFTPISIDEIINEYPPSLQNRINIIDRNGKDYSKVQKYLKPIFNEIEDTPNIISYHMIEDFLYKVLLASKNNAEADVSFSRFIGEYIRSLREYITDDEARFRLDQLSGIYSNYSKPLKIEAYTVIPDISMPSIYEKISDFLDEAEILELSSNRYLLGIPSKSKIAYLKIKKGLGYFLSEKKYEKYIKPAVELMKVGGFGQSMNIPDVDFLRKLYPSKYSPPLTDLDYYRVQTCKKISPNSLPNFVLPDGVTRAIDDSYFR